MDLSLWMLLQAKPNALRRLALSLGLRVKNVDRRVLAERVERIVNSPRMWPR